jgi:hypothetical protein
MVLVIATRKPVRLLHVIRAPLQDTPKKIQICKTAARFDLN